QRRDAAQRCPRHPHPLTSSLHVQRDDASKGGMGSQAERCRAGRARRRPPSLRHYGAPVTTPRCGSSASVTFTLLFKPSNGSVHHSMKLTGQSSRATSRTWTTRGAAVAGRWSPGRETALPSKPVGNMVHVALCSCTCIRGGPT